MEKASQGTSVPAGFIICNPQPSAPWHGALRHLHAICGTSPLSADHHLGDLERETATQGILGSKWNSGRPYRSLCGTSKTDLERETATQGILGSKWNSGRPYRSLCGTSKTDLERETATQRILRSKWNRFYTLWICAISRRRFAAAAVRRSAGSFGWLSSPPAAAHQCFHEIHK
jgi:hypothetical protein